MSFSLRHFEVLDSTQNRALEILVNDPKLDGVWVRASHQESGRGRMGRTWLDTPGEKLLLSFAWRSPIAALPWTWIPLLAGEALHLSLEALGWLPKDAFLKWPNDMMVDGDGGWQKIGGILSEVHGGNKILVVGWGVNLTAAPAIPEAAALSEWIAADKLNVQKLCDELCPRFEKTLRRWFLNPNEEGLRLRAFLETRGMLKLWGREGNLSDGTRCRALGLGEGGTLIAEVLDGSKKGQKLELHSGEFLLKRM